MTSGPTLPPQAYTREILTSAFNWLQTQPESARKLATTPDALVGLFMRAQRFGNSSPEQDAPVSSQNFMSDLKNLAEGLKQFEQPVPETRTETRTEPRREAPRAIPPEPHRSEPQRPVARESTRDFGRDSSREPRRPMSQAFAANGSTASYAAGSTWNREFFAETATAMPSSSATFKAPPQRPLEVPHQEAPPLFEQPMIVCTEYANGLNERSLAMIQEVKAEQNLSSDIEAVNMMLALAYKSLKNLIV